MNPTTHRETFREENSGRMASQGSPSVGSIWLVGIAATIFLGMILNERLDDPPLWDAAWTTSAGAADLSRNGFNYAELLASPPFHEGGPGTHASSLLTPLLGLFFVIFGSPGGLIAGHLLMVVVGGATVAATYALGSRYLPRLAALALAGATSVLPLIVQQVGDPYVDLPLALFTLLTVIAVLDGRRFRAAAFVGLAIWFKPTGLMLLPLLALMGDEEGSRRWLKNGLTVLLAATPFAIVVMGRSMATHVGAIPTVDGTLSLVRTAFWILGATTDVLVILVLFCLGSIRLRHKHPGLVGVVGLLTVSFFGLHLVTMALSQAVSILPRYYIALVPLWLVVVATYMLEEHSQRVAVGFFVLLVSFSVLNWNGTLYPLADHSQAPMAERSPGGGKEYLEMEIAATRALVASSDHVDVLIVDNAVWFRVTYPELGFVDEVPKNIRLGLIDESSLSDSFAWIEEPHIAPAMVTPAQVAENAGWTVERATVWDGRWQSELINARP